MGLFDQWLEGHRQKACFERAEKYRRTAYNYESGLENFPRSPTEAVKYFTKAAGYYLAADNKLKAAECCCQTGEGENGQEHYDAANLWFEMALKLLAFEKPSSKSDILDWCQRETTAYVNLADNYAEGNGVETDHAKASEYYGNAVDIYLLADKYDSLGKVGTAKHYCRKAVEQAEMAQDGVLIEKWQKKAAEVNKLRIPVLELPES